MPNRIGRTFDFIEEFNLLKDRVRRLELTRAIIGQGDGVMAYSVPGTLTVMDGSLRWYPIADGTIKRIYAAVGTASTTSNVQIRVNKNGTVLEYIVIPSGDNSNDISPDEGDYREGDYFTVDLTSVGNAADLVVQLHHI